VTNRGPATATAVTASDTLPGQVRLIRTNPPCGGSSTLSCVIGTIQRGATATIVIDVVHIVGQPGPIVNRVNAFGREIDPSSGNNSDSVSTSLGLTSEEPDLFVTYQTELTLERPRRRASGFIVINNAQVQQVSAGGAQVLRTAAESGSNRFEAYVEPGAAGQGLWRFDFRASDRIIPGSLKVESGRQVSLDSQSIVFAVDGESRIRFTVDFQ
jgi:hypothetical protein